jgi:hypothetical protein
MTVKRKSFDVQANAQAPMFRVAAEPLQTPTTVSIATASLNLMQ